LEETTLEFAEGQLHGLFCRLEGDAPLPLVVIVHDIYGLREQIRGLARRLAQEGFAVFAPHFIGRMRRNAFEPNRELKEARAVTSTISEAQIRRDIDAAIEVAAAQPGVDGDRKAVWGCCWGGAFVFPTLADRHDLSAGIVFYGGLAEERTESCPRRPLDCVSAIRSPIALHYGESDPFAPVETIHRLEALLKANGVHYELCTYPDASHAFCDQESDNFSSEAAARAWDRTLSFLKRYV